MVAHVSYGTGVPKTHRAPPRLTSATTRREFLRNSVAAAVALGAWPALSPAGEAMSRIGKGPEPPNEFRVLTAAEARTYDAWCDRLAPGAAKAGVSRFLDAQLAAPHEEALLFLKVLGNPPFEPFYRDGIAGIEREVRARFGDDASFPALDEVRQREVIDAAVAATTVEWKNPPPDFFFFVSRGDAVDVAYGTVEGFRRLKVPYMPHIWPRKPW